MTKKEGMDMGTFARVLRVSCGVGLLTIAVWLNDSGTVRGADELQAAEKVAEKVEKKVERTEKAEGKHDLVEDSVKAKVTPEGAPVVEQVGEASFYGKNHHGKETASGEKFNQHELTAAHPTLPLGTEATVTNLETGKSVDVTINDRGPYVKGRDIDLSKAAATEIGMKKDGEAPVKIEAELPPQTEDKTASDKDAAKAKEKK